MKKSLFLVPALSAVLLAAVTIVSCGGGTTPPPLPPATYSVSGVVSGLSGTGLVLRNNDGDDLAIASSGTFTFDSKLASNATYSVTVKTHPTSLTQTCAVSNGTGTVAAANVTSMLVSCVTRTYSVGGMVSGLTGTGLTLLNNGGNNLVVASSGTFTFTTWIFDGALYSVTVGTQPVDPLQVCIVSSGSGTMAAASITNVSVSCLNAVLVLGSICSRDADCGSSNCECADATCSIKKCGRAQCSACTWGMAPSLYSACPGNIAFGIDPNNDCPGYMCNGSGACLTSCGSSSDCDTDRFCSAAVCQLKLDKAFTCSSDEQCLSGSCAPDNKCCETACIGGTCSNGECTGLPKASTCSATDQCGAGLFCDTTGTSVCCESQCSNLLGTCTAGGDCIGLPLGAVCAIGDTQCANGGGTCPGTGVCP